MSASFDDDAAFIDKITSNAKRWEWLSDVERLAYTLMAWEHSHRSERMWSAYWGETFDIGGEA